MILKLLKRAQAQPGVVVRDKRTGVAILVHIDIKGMEKEFLETGELRKPWLEGGNDIYQFERKIYALHLNAQRMLTKEGYMTLEELISLYGEPTRKYRIPPDVVVTRHGEPCLTIKGMKITYSLVKTAGELKGFEALLAELQIPYMLAKGEKNYIKK